MKTILIVGAGHAQVPLIEAANKEGYRTVVCDMDKAAPGVRLADEFCAVSTRDRRGLLAVAKECRIDGIVANSEYAMCDVAHIAHTMGLVGMPEEAAATLSSKGEFRALQKSAGLYAPTCLQGSSAEQLLAGTPSLKFPVVVKPDQSSGTRGTNIIASPSNREALEQSISTCLEISRNDKAVVEEYMPVPSRSTIEGEVFVHDGRILWDGLFQTIRGGMDGTIPMTYVFPLKENGERLTALREALTRALDVAGATHGEFNAEAYFTSSGEPFIIEINPRQGGNDLPRYVQEHCGVDLYRLLVTTSMGDDRYWRALKNRERERRPIIHHVLYPWQAGRFRGVHIDDSIAGNVYRSQVDVTVGDVLAKTVDASSCIGYVDLEFSNTTEQLEASQRMEQLIRIDVDEVASQ